MDTHLIMIIAIIVIGTILLAIVGAFIFSGTFRKDVIASEGEASLLGMFNVKGVIIVLLTAIFCVVFIVILNKIPDSNKVNNQSKNQVVNSSEHRKKNTDSVMNVLKSKASLELSACHNIKTRVDLRTENKVDNNLSFYYIIDSVISTGDHKYYVRFGEKNSKGKMIWADPKQYSKTKDGAITNASFFEDIYHSDWKRKYSVLLSLGEPRTDIEAIDLTSIIVAAAEVKWD